MYIKQWRQFRHMKMEALAQKAGLSIGTISQIENGKQGYTRRSLEAIAKALDTKPGYLLEFDPTRHQLIVMRLE